MKNTPRLVAGIAAGFIGWFIVFFGTDSVLKRVWASYASANEGARFSKTILIILLIVSVASSFAAGYVASMIARESRKSTWILGAVLVIGAVFFQLTDWDRAALWFNVAFLVSIMPFTILGGYLRN